MKISSFIATTLFAAAAGVIAGTLFAPGKGSRTRNRITRKGQGYKDYLMDNFDNFADSVSHPFEKLEDETIRLRKKANAKVKQIKTGVNQKLN